MVKKFIVKKKKLETCPFCYKKFKRLKQHLKFCSIKPPKPPELPKQEYFIPSIEKIIKAHSLEEAIKIAGSRKG